MPDRIKESDWKLYRELSEVALQRAFEHGVATIQSLATAEVSTDRDRFWNTVEFVNHYKKELADTFDGASRSNALFHLTRFANRHLLTAEELSRFSAEARDFVRRLQEINRPSEPNP